MQASRRCSRTFVPVVALLIDVGIVPEMSNALVGHFPTPAPLNRAAIWSYPK